MTAFSEAQRAARDHFEASLNHGMGDLETMLAGLWYRLNHAGAEVDANVPPPGYRSEKLRAYLRDECGARRTTQWGATALRGRLKPATKGHIIRFLELVNALAGDELEAPLLACGRLYATKVNRDADAIVLPKRSTVQQQLFALLHTKGSVGKVQQGLVYAMLVLEDRYRRTDLNIHTKRTHAGDRQSRNWGDVTLSRSGVLLASYEVKAMTITQADVDRFLPTYGERTYPLFILALDFRPKALQDDLNALTDTFAIRLFDFLLTKLAGLHTLAQTSPQSLLDNLIALYNADFCDAIENDPTIKIIIDE